MEIDKALTTIDKVMTWVIVCAIIAAAITLPAVVLKESFTDVEKVLDPEERKIYLAASILSVLTSMWIISFVASVWGPQPVDGREPPGKQAFDKLTTPITTMMTMVLTFYFTLPAAPSTPQSLQLKTLEISDPSPKKGQEISISSSASGGKPPYTYTFSFVPAKGLDPKSNNSPDGSIEEKITIPNDAGTDITVKLEVKDSDKKPSSKTQEKKIIVKQ